ncbi:MAG: thiamine phosphate synthase, partial [Myxococcales bacterium]|nr:thiamine phosphate synthase [Myxococcales bacterium]
GFARAVAGAGLPVYALGGIGPDLVAALADAGASGVATIGAVFGQADPAGAAAALLAPWAAPRADT